MASLMQWTGNWANFRRWREKGGLCRPQGQKELNMTGQLNSNKGNIWGFPGGAMVKNLPADARDAGLIPGSIQKIPWKRKWQPLQYCCLENPMDRGAWWAIVHGGHKESDLTEHMCVRARVHTHAYTYTKLIPRSR